MRTRLRLSYTTLLVAVAWACDPRRAPDIAGVVTSLERDPRVGWRAMVEADPADPGLGGRLTPKVEVTLGGRSSRGLRVGCRVRVWYTNGGMAKLSYPGQAWAEAIRIDGCLAGAGPPSRPAA